MKAAIYRKYGGPEVVRIEDTARPAPGPGEMLVKVAHGSVTTADWRLRAAAFPGVLAVPGRLMFGLRRPRQPVLGSEFSGEVVALGAGVTEFAPGQAVFGFVMQGAHAEYLVVKAAGAVLPVPEGLDPAEAAALPFGGLSALVFLRDYAKLAPGQKLLVVGASGGVGAYAVQIARALGAEVTGVASGAHEAFVRGLGAVGFVDYRRQSLRGLGSRFDVVIDTVGATDFATARAVLAPRGVFVPLNFGVREIGQALWSQVFGRRKLRLGVSGDTKADLRVLARWVEEGRLRPVIDRRFPLTEIRAAYALVEGRHRQGAILLDMAA
ncbi:NAD(P)-dependent alcohol dehydrogenase [Marinovum algicola]|uniref:NAD(P)-dependent alcohol dehydrogenase n=1 Tax=Marinovum algicola TaxID=42444 RepID=UPI0024BADFED|nr:NAD(P)-dependent alcohol dehydrogenase [Marinovum algicola]